MVNGSHTFLRSMVGGEGVGMPAWRAALALPAFYACPAWCARDARGGMSVCACRTGRARDRAMLARPAGLIPHGRAPS